MRRSDERKQWEHTYEEEALYGFSRTADGDMPPSFAAELNEYADALEKARAELAAVRAERDEARREVERLKGLLHRDRTGLAAALVEVKKRAAGGRWISEGRGSYAWDEDDYRKETGWLVTDIVRLAEEALHASGNLANEAFHPRPPPITPGSPTPAKETSK